MKLPHFDGLLLFWYAAGVTRIPTSDLKFASPFDCFISAPMNWRVDSKGEQMKLIFNCEISHLLKMGEVSLYLGESVGIIAITRLSGVSSLGNHSSINCCSCSDLSSDVNWLINACSSTNRLNWWNRNVGVVSNQNDRANCRAFTNVFVEGVLKPEKSWLQQLRLEISLMQCELPSFKRNSFLTRNWTTV